MSDYTHPEFLMVHLPTLFLLGKELQIIAGMKNKFTTQCVVYSASESVYIKKVLDRYWNQRFRCNDKAIKLAE